MRSIRPSATALIVTAKFTMRCHCGGNVVPGRVIHDLTIHLDYMPDYNRPVSRFRFSCFSLSST
jgi:hypothetical protein